MLEVGQEWILHISPFRLKETTTPTDAQVPANVLALYAKDNGSGTSTLCYKNDAGTEVCMPTSGSIVTGTGVANRLTYWATSTTIDDVPRTFTAGSVLFAHSDFLPQEDNANLFWDNTNNFLGIGTNTPAAPLHTVGVVRSAFASGQTYDWSRHPVDLNVLTLQSQSSGTLFNIGLFAKDGDGTDALTVNIFGKGTPTSFTDTERLQLAYNTSGPTFSINTQAAGAGTVRALHLLTGANTGQLVLNTDGSISVAGHTTIGGGATASELRLLEPSGGGSSYTSFKSPALAANVNYTLPSDDGDAGQVLSTDGSGVLDWITAAGSNHAILDGSVHTDSVAQTVSRGSLIYGNATPKWDELVVGSAGAFLRNDGTDTMWSTLILPNAATSTRLVYATAANTYGESADLTYDGTDLAIASGKRFRMQSQNRIRYLNSMAIVTHDANQSINNSTVTTLAFNTSVVNTDSMWSSGDNTKLTCNLTGKYIIGGLAAWEVNAGGTYRQILIKKNGTTFVVSQVVASISDATPQQIVARLISLTATDYIQMQVQQNSGGALNCLTGADFAPIFFAVYVGE